MEVKYKILTVAVLCSLSAALGYYATPTKTKIVVQEKIVEHVSREKVKDRHIVIKEAPNGSKETTIDEHSTVSTESETKTSKTETKEITKGSKLDWLATGQLGVEPSSLSLNPATFQVSVARRIVGPIYLGLSFNSDLELGALITIGF